MWQAIWFGVVAVVVIAFLPFWIRLAHTIARLLAWAAVIVAGFAVVGIGQYLLDQATTLLSDAEHAIPPHIVAAILPCLVGVTVLFPALALLWRASVTYMKRRTEGTE